MELKRVTAASAAALVFAVTVTAAKADTVAWYRFEDGVPGQVVAIAVDTLGVPGQDGAALGDPILFSSESPPLAGGLENQLSASFNGTPGQSILFAYEFPLHVSGPFTLEFFVKFNHSNHESIIWSRADSDDLNRFNVYTTHPGAGPSFGFDYRAPDGTLHPIANPTAFPVELGRWTHIAITRTGDNYEWFRNGVSMGSSTDSLPELPTSFVWQLSGRSDLEFNGLLDEVRISNTVLTPDEFLFTEEGPPGVPLDIAVDIKPGSCPNPLNVNSKGVLPVAVLGTADFDVTLIDPDSVRLQGLPPLQFNLEDVATPFEGLAEGCGGCTSLGADGFLDMTFKFDTTEVVTALGSIRNGNCVKVPLTGTLREEYGGTPIDGADSVKVIKGGKKESLVFFDDFEGDDFSEKWVSGNTCGTNTITSVGGRIQATDNCNYIETLASFSGNLRIEVDVEKEGGLDHGCWDFYVEMAVSGASGAIRFDTAGVDAIGIGYLWEICGDQYAMDASASNAGHAVLTYADSSLHFFFENTDGDVLATDEVPLVVSGPSPIRIWLAAHPGSPRYVDNVRIYELPDNR